MEQHVPNRLLVQTPDDELVHAQPLTEDHDLRARLLEHLVEQRHQFVRFDPEVRLVIQQVGAVAAHAHVLETNHEPALIGLREELVPAPLRHDPRDSLAVLLVVRTLLARHRHNKVLFSRSGN